MTNKTSSNIVVVTYNKPFFMVKDTNSNTEVAIDESILHDTTYRYKSDFKRIFLRKFPPKTECKIEFSARERLEEILYLNRH